MSSKPRFTTFLVTMPLLAAGLAPAQTIGVPHCNEYSINGVPGVPCAHKFLTPITTLSVSCEAPFQLVGFYFSSCPCSPCTMPLPPNACGTPLSACFGSNQSVDIPYVSPCFIAGCQYVLAVPDGIHGLATLRVVLPNLPIPAAGFATQAVILDPLGPLAVTQAYTVH